MIIIIISISFKIKYSHYIEPLNRSIIQNFILCIHKINFIHTTSEYKKDNMTF